MESQNNTEKSEENLQNMVPPIIQVHPGYQIESITYQNGDILHIIDVISNNAQVIPNAMAPAPIFWENVVNVESNGTPSSSGIHEVPTEELVQNIFVNFMLLCLTYMTWIYFFN